jgi:ABC-type sugar transport system ATPase subunit
VSRTIEAENGRSAARAHHGGAGVILQTRDLTKQYGGTIVLNEVSLALEKSSVLALVGENGAGKSTLIKIVSGAVKSDAGSVAIDGETVQLNSPAEGTAHGVATVYQELSLLPDLTVAENMFLGMYPKRRGVIRWREARREAERMFAELGVSIPVDLPVGRLGLAERYIVEIAKAVRHRPSILILDEPTAALDPHDSERIFQLMDDLRAGGTSMIFVSHRLDELFRCAQQYVVLRDGRKVADGRMADTSQDDLVAKMLGHVQAAPVALPPVRRAAARAASTHAETAFKAVGMATEHVRNVTFEGRPGEVIGIAGLRGSGQSNVCLALAGAERLTGGEMFLSGQPYRPRSPSQGLRSGVAFVPIDRKTQGLFLNLTVAQNLGMCRMVKTAPHVVSESAERILAEEYRDKLSIRLPAGRVDTPITALSGGNQQKVLVAKCLATNPSVMILSEPTRGVDVAAKQQIHELIRQLASQDLCVIVSSPELEELMELSTSMLVMHRGEMVAELRGNDMNEHDILRYASGASE